MEQVEPEFYRQVLRNSQAFASAKAGNQWNGAHLSGLKFSIAFGLLIVEVLMVGGLASRSFLES